MNLFDAVKRANRPGPPEHSIPLRGGLCRRGDHGIAACGPRTSSRGRLQSARSRSRVGMILAYRTRERPPWIKPILAISGWQLRVFFRQLTGQTIYDVSTVESPLAVLFVWVQVRTPSTSRPARPGLLAGRVGQPHGVAAAQAIDLASASMSSCGWRSGWPARRHVELGQRGWTPASRRRARHLGIGRGDRHRGARRPSRPHVRGASTSPPTRPGSTLPVPGGLAGDTKVAQLAKPGTAADATRVGGTGVLNHLDTALRGALGDTVVMRVRADRPSYWIGESFDSWDGAHWSATPPRTARNVWTRARRSSSRPRAGPGRRATFRRSMSCSPRRTSSSMPTRPTKCGFPTHDLFISDQDSIVSPIGLGPGAIYTVESY